MFGINSEIFNAFTREEAKEFFKLKQNTQNKEDTIQWLFTNFEMYTNGYDIQSSTNTYDCNNFNFCLSNLINIWMDDCRNLSHTGYIEPVERTNLLIISDASNMVWNNQTYFEQ